MQWITQIHNGHRRWCVMDIITLGCYGHNRKWMLKCIIATTCFQISETTVFAATSIFPSPTRAVQWMTHTPEGSFPVVCDGERYAEMIWSRPASCQIQLHANQKTSWVDSR